LGFANDASWFAGELAGWPGEEPVHNEEIIALPESNSY